MTSPASRDVLDVEKELLEIFRRSTENTRVFYTFEERPFTRVPCRRHIVYALIKKKRRRHGPDKYGTPRQDRGKRSGERMRINETNTECW